MKGTELIMAGFGGQGVLLAGKILAHAAMAQGLEVSWLPSYGPEMRGGTANVTVCISEERIGSPLITEPKALLAMNLPSLEKFESKVKPDGVIVINATLIKKEPHRPDCECILVKSKELAEGAGNPKAANLVMLGAYVGATDILPSSAVEDAIAEAFKGGKEKHVEGSILAFRAGFAQGRMGHAAG